MMDTIWTVERNTGKQADLSCESERREIFRPHDMSGPEFYSLLTPGTAVEGRVLEEMFKIPWPIPAAKPPQS
jgi:hypothetical protein